MLETSVLHFDFDKDALTPFNQKYLRDIASAMQSCPAAKIVISGNCDDRGTEEYNMALGQRRAYAAKKYLTDLGIDGNRIDTVSYGFEKPVDDRQTEEGWAMNRRDDFSLVGNVAVSSRANDP